MTYQTQMVFDTDCVLCSGVVHFILTHERAPTIQFVNAWSKPGLALAAHYGLSRDDLNETFLVVENGVASTKSEGALRVLGHLRPPWSWLTALRFVPRFIRDGVYSIIARRRYRWFGQKAQCFRPISGMGDRFVDS